jgi:phosphomannomutase/phosphoglucomutase
MKIESHIFREYDIRGVVDRDLSEEFAYLLGRAYGTLARENRCESVAVGYDCRLSSPGYAAALTRGINAEGVDVLQTGMGPTPQLYYTIFAHKLGGGIQVTGSHNPPDMNGFKLCLGELTLSGEAIQDLYRRMVALDGVKPTATPGTAKPYPIQDEYISALIENSRPHMGSRKLKVVVDAGNGVGGMVGPKVLRGLGVEVVELYCEPDGRFPNHHPDPTVLENIEELIATVRKTGADLGIGWDGDADRIGAVDEQGNVIFGDMLLLIYGRSILEKVPGASIIGDVKCSGRLFHDLTARGGKALMWKTGHSLIKNKLREIGGELGGEMSGHIFFKHRFYGFDDAIYASCRLVEIVSHADRPASALLADLPKAVATPEIRVDCPEELKFKIPERAKTTFKDYEVNTIDGVRITFDHGWGLIRASNTQPVLVLRFEADSAARLEEYQRLVTDKIEEIKAALAGSMS